MTTRKLSFDTIGIAITRRCNMEPQCDHCFRGDAQPIDISDAAIDALLNQTEMIEQLYLTGGEPFVNIKGMWYILDGLTSRNIPLYSLQITTNGLCTVQKVAPVMQAYAEYILECRAHPTLRYRHTDPQEPPINLLVSLDDWHRPTEQTLQQTQQYAKSLKGLAFVGFQTNGMFPNDCGRAVDHIPKNRKFVDLKIAPIKIALIDAANKPVCMSYRTFRLMHPDQAIVACSLEVSAIGRLCSSFLASRPYTETDAPDAMICDVLKTPSIYDAIIDYNKRSGLVDCLERHLQKIEAGKNRPFNFRADRSDLVKYIATLQAESVVKVYGDVDSLTPDEHRALDRNVDMSMEQRRKILEKARQRCQRYNYIDYEHDPQILKEYLYQLGRGGQLVADNWLYNKLHGYA